MDIKYLKDFYGSENSFLTDFPAFSFFNKRTLHHYKYIDAIQKNRVERYTNFCRNNFKYEPTDLSDIYIVNINNILNKDQHHLIHGIFIYLFNSEPLSINNITLKIGDIVFDYDLCKLFFTDRKYSSVLYECNKLNCCYVKLPVELFDDTHSWINLINDVPIELIVKLHFPVKIRVDFLTITLDSEEAMRYNLRLNKPQQYECLIRHNDIMELNVKDKIRDNKLVFNLSHIKDGIKELSLFFKVNNNIVDNNFINNITFCVTKHDKIVEIKQDALQLLCSNKVNKNSTFIYDFPLSLFPENYHPSGDFLINDFEVSLIVSLNIWPSETLYDNMTLVLVINKIKAIKYYIDDDNNCKCKFLHLQDMGDFR